MLVQTLPLKVEVVDYKFKQNDNSIVHYTITVQHHDQVQWQMDKRYSEFDELHANLKKLIIDFQSELPGKSLLKLTQPNDLDKRRQGLDNYLKDILKRQDVRNSQPLWTFLLLDQYAPELLSECFQKMDNFFEYSQGVQDFLIERNQELILVLQSNASFKAKLDAYLSNMMQKASNKPTAGCLECWRLSKSKGESPQTSYERIWTKSFTTQAVCIYFDECTQFLFVGFKDGVISLLRLDPNFEFADVAEIQAHSDKITGIFYSPLNACIHSISRDQTYRIYDIQRQLLISDIQPSKYPLNDLLPVPKKKMLLLSDSEGSVFLYSIANISLATDGSAEEKRVQLITLIKTQIGSIRGLQFDSANHLLFVSGRDSAKIKVYEINSENWSEFKVREELETKTKGRQLIWAQSLQQIVLASGDGICSVWQNGVRMQVFRAFDQGLSRMRWNDFRQTLAVGSKESGIAFWKLVGKESEEWKSPPRKSEDTEELRWSG